MSLLAHYKFEDNLTDETTSYDGSAVGSIGYDAGGVVGKALSMATGQNGFDTGGGLGAALNGLSTFTIDLYIKPTDITNAYNCIWRDNGGGGGNMAYVQPNGNVWGVINATGCGGFNTDNGIVTAGDWNRVTLILDGANDTFKIYVNTVLKYTKEGVTGAITFADAEVAFGQDNWGNQDLNGLMDEVKIYDSVELPLITYPTVTAQASIVGTRSKTVSARAWLGASPKEITAKANIKSVTDRTITAKGSIKRLATQTVSGKARIEIQSSQTLQAKGRIQITSSQSVEAKGSIFTSQEQTVTAKAAIRQAFGKGVSAKGQILVIKVGTVTAKAEIHMFVELFDSNTYKDAGATTADWDIITEKVRLSEAPC